MFDRIKKTYKIFKNKLKKKKYSKKELIKRNLKYENQDHSLIYPKVKTKEETLKELINTNKSISRFGDGEFYIIWGKNIPFQKFSKKLQSKLKKILLSKNENIIIAIPNIFSDLTIYNSYASNFWRKFIVINRKKIYKNITLKKQYFDTEVSRPYIDLADKTNVGEHFKEIKKIWKDKDIVFIEGKMSRLGVGNDLFNNCRTIKRIICPACDAFDIYEKIIEECEKLPKETLFIIALGPTATALAYDLSELGYRALDLGHIDIEYEWFLRKATKKIAIENKYVNEVKNGHINNILCDKKYLSEIIKDLTL